MQPKKKHTKHRHQPPSHWKSTHHCRSRIHDPATPDNNPLKGLQLRMWDFAQCDPKRCTGARLERRGVFRKMPLKQPFKGIVLSPNGTVSVSPADRPILQEMASRIDVWICIDFNTDGLHWLIYNCLSNNRVLVSSIVHGLDWQKFHSIKCELVIIVYFPSL